MRWRTAMIVLRGERHQVHALATHADRAVRTRAARSCAIEAHALLHAVTTLTHALGSLSTRAGWTQLSADSFQFSFGRRRAVIVVPQSFTPAQLASLIVRTEIKVLLGDLQPELLEHLQSFAARELENLMA
ncbi:MAG TPA: hypothetical protein VHK90_11285 [Thermoanaerobaculia bacterium]|nr:hypothetical protein [Thermoanaerobaculia bacterium]